MHLRLRLLGSAVLVSTVCACAGNGAIKPDSAAVRSEGKARNVPVYIYRTSWSSPTFGGGRMEVGLAAFDEKQIDVIELSLATCGTKGTLIKEKPLILGGPFRKDGVYDVYPSWPLDYADLDAWGTVDSISGVASSGHLVIQAVTLEYSDGSRQVYDKDLASLLSKGISNFCSNAPSFGNLPPSATIRQH